MNIEKFVQEMPKVELNIRLEGAFRLETLLNIAEQNDIPNSLKKYKNWVELLKDPDYHDLDTLIQTTSQWLYHPDDLTRLVYDAGVYFFKQNVKYAEVSVNPMLYLPSGITFEKLLSAINDGRDRVERGWGVQMRWVLTVPRNEPRHADEISRWAVSAAGRKGGIVGFSVVGDETAQPIGQFARAFTNIRKKEIPGYIEAGDKQGAEGILEALDQIHPDRILHGWGAADAPDVLDKLSNDAIPLVVSMAHALCTNQVQTYANYPLKQLYDENVKAVISADMPLLYKSTLSDEYLAAVEHCNLSVDELQDIALNAVRYSTMPADEKSILLEMFEAEYSNLRQELDIAETN